MRTLLILLLASALLFAQDQANDIFRIWDTNGDGVLTADEIPDAAIFAKVDADKSGKITREEVARFLGGAPAPTKKPEPKKKADERKSEGTMVFLPPRTLNEHVEDFFRRFDKNKDGKVQREEFQAGEEVFKKYDRSRDGNLSRREVRRYVREQLEEAKRRPRPDNFFDLFDLNRDGKVTRKEYDGPAAFFREYDHNKDGKVTTDELNMGPMAGRMMRGDREFLGDGATSLPKRGLLERYDKDGDGRVTLEELGGAESILHRLDRNGDGVLSGGEVR
ncbi:MAG: EF-hand domain-containing protein [Planctomycetota bacterium]|jgi:Ca2+-binding EF-hand superfamily protein